jgi:hypothetical protein
MVKVRQITEISIVLGELSEPSKLGEFNKLSKLSHIRFKLTNFDGLALDKELDQQ